MNGDKPSSKTTMNYTSYKSTPLPEYPAAIIYDGSYYKLFLFYVNADNGQLEVLVALNNEYH